MKVLVVDDTEVMLLLISKFVEAMGHSVVLARNGEEAIEVFHQENPDMVLLDMIMPNMDGDEAARRIKASVVQRWVPIVFITAVGEINKLADAIEQGADDYLIKPINFRILEAKIKAIERSIALHNQVLDQSIRLADYYHRAEEEKQVARHLMDQLINTDRLADPLLQYHVLPAESLSGDLIAASRTPGRILHVLLADGIGHGLTAALNVLPLTQPFYAMTEKGFSVREILTEMNAKVRQVLSRGRFVAMSIVAIDPSRRCIEVWNGGMPQLHFYNRSGELVRLWKSQHLPLGILSREDFDSTTETFIYQDEGSLLMYSDGLVEARNPEGDAFGYTRIDEAMQTLDLDARLLQLQTGLQTFLSTGVNHDDVSIALIKILFSDESPRTLTFVPETLPAVNLALPDFSIKQTWHYSLGLGIEELRTVNAIPMIMGFLSQLKELEGALSDIFLIISELFNNALDHGLLGLSTHVRDQDSGMIAYLGERAERLAAIQEGFILIELSGGYRGEHSVLTIRVKDSGQGFEHIDWLKEQNTAQTNARGIALVRSICVSLEYIGVGNEVVACYQPSLHRLSV